MFISRTHLNCDAIWEVQFFLPFIVCSGAPRQWPGHFPQFVQHNHNATLRNTVSLLAQSTQFLARVCRFRWYLKTCVHEIINNHLTTLTRKHTGMEDSTCSQYGDSLRAIWPVRSTWRAVSLIFCTICRLVDLHVTTYPSSTKGPFVENSAVGSWRPFSMLLPRYFVLNISRIMYIPYTKPNLSQPLNKNKFYKISTAKTVTTIIYKEETVLLKINLIRAGVPMYDTASKIFVKSLKTIMGL